MFNLILLILGDLVVIVLQGFYMGVGIRQSSPLTHILGLTLPTLMVWGIAAAALGIYRLLHRSIAMAESQPAENSERGSVGWLLWDKIEKQRVFRLGAVWLIVSLFAVFWQTWYWNRILQQNRGISVRFTLFFCLFGIFLLALWRFVWTVFVIVRVLVKKYPLFRAFCYLAVTALVLFQVPALIITLQSAPDKISLADFNRTDYPVAVVFGAGVYRNGTASSVLRDRVETAALLYQKGAVERLLMSGDNSAASRYETDVMTGLAAGMGVPLTAIDQDESGLNTQLTCQNAVEKFGVTKGVLVTQSFHTSRALYSCEKSGMDALAVAADISVYNIFSWLVWQSRDWTGLTLAWLSGM